MHNDSMNSFPYTGISSLGSLGKGVPPSVDARFRRYRLQLSYFFVSSLLSTKKGSSVTEALLLNLANLGLRIIHN